MITFDEFKKMDMRVARVVSCEVHPDADKLYVLKVDDGEGMRQIVAGVRNFYTPEELANKQVVVLVNLQPATIRGIESQGMMLCAKGDNALTFIGPEKEVKPGSKIS